MARRPARQGPGDATRPARERGKSPSPAAPGADPASTLASRSRDARMRIQRALARAGVTSRRRADELVAAGRVTVNGVVAIVGQTVDASRDRITIDGTQVSHLPAVAAWLVMHKPAGVLTTARDERGAGRRTVFDLVPPALRRPGLTYVGRLDYMTEGLLLLTDDGTAAHRLSHPRHAVDRTYVATVQGKAVAAARALRRGIVLADGPVRPREVSVQSIGNRRWDLEITIAEGRTHEVRRACEELGLRVERLVRTRFGPIRLGTLAPGAVRPLSAAERQSLEART